MSFITVTKTQTGQIYVDRDRCLEWLSVGDYGKENNLKANFLGLDKPICGVHHKTVHLSDKWVITISTQKGCRCSCDFCDVPKVGYAGNVSIEDFRYMICEALRRENCQHTKRLNVHFARMGEPTFNDDVLYFTSDHLDSIVNSLISADTIHPVVSTMLPNNNPFLVRFLLNWCKLKNERNGEAGLQFSIQSTDKKQRETQFKGHSLDLCSIANVANKLPFPKGRKYTLNFAVTKDTILDAKYLSGLFDKDKWLVKITPIHKTATANANNYDVTTEYNSYDVYAKFEQPLVNEGWDVIVFVPSKEEDTGRITCGNALLADLTTLSSSVGYSE